MVVRVTSSDTSIVFGVNSIAVAEWANWLLSLQRQEHTLKHMWLSAALQAPAPAEDKHLKRNQFLDL